MRARTAIWVLAAILGIVLAAGLSWATSQLTSQHIGLASEPLTAGQRLAPPPESSPKGTGEPRRRSRESTQPTSSGATPAPSTVGTATASTPAAPAASERAQPAEPAREPRAGRQGDDGSQPARQAGAGRERRDD